MSLKARDKAINRRSVFARNSNTPTFLKNEPFFVYNGKRFKCVNVYPTLLRKKMGEFVITRKPFHFPKKKEKIILWAKQVYQLSTDLVIIHFEINPEITNLNTNHF